MRAMRPDGSVFDSLTLGPPGVQESPNDEGRSTSRGAQITSVLSPTSGRVQFSFTLPKPANVNAVLYDPTGRRVATLVHGHFDAGEHRASREGVRLQPGTYSLALESGGSVCVERVVVLGRD
jgi:hypothetical protein